MADAAALERPESRAPRLTARRWKQAAAVVVGWAAFFGIWEFASEVLFNPYRLPGPLDVFDAMADTITSGQAWEAFRASLGKIFLGFGLGVALGLPTGFLMGRYRYWRAFFHDPVIVAGSVPAITYAVLALVIFGIGLVGPIVSVALVAMPYIALNVAAGLEGIDNNLLTMAQAFRARNSDVIRHVLIPTITPFVFAGVRLSFALAWKVEALTEVFGSSSGIGFEIRQAYQQFSIVDVLAWTALFVIFMLLLERFVLLRLERRLFRWRPQEVPT
jgi:NitT/TauT family transport system permease protein